MTNDTSKLVAKKNGRNRLIFFSFFAFISILAVVELSLKATIFPSLVFPGFSTSTKFDKDVKLKVINLYAVDNKGNHILLDKHAFFNNIYYKYVNFLVKSIVRNESEAQRHQVADEDRDSFEAFAQTRLKELHPQIQFNGLLVVEGKKLYDVKNKSVDNNIIDKHETFFRFTTATE